MQITATSWLLYQLTNSAFQLGLNGIFRAIPSVAFALFGGTLADRWNRRRLMLTTQVTLMLLAFLLGLLVQTGRVALWHIYALTLVSAIVGGVDAPARQSLFPSLVPSSVLPNAIALNSLLFKGTVIIGPALAGITITLIGTDGAFYANAASFLAVVLALILMKTPMAKPSLRKRFLADLQEGISYVVNQKMLLGIMCMEAVSSVFGLDQAMLTIFARDVLHEGAQGLGLLQSSRGLGAVTGSLILIFLGQPAAQGKLLLASAFLCAVSFALFGISNFFPLSLFMLFLVGASDTIWAATRNTILQVQTADQMRGRVMGVFSVSNRGLTPLGQVETGFVVPVLGARETTLLGGLIVALVTSITAWKIPAIYRFLWRQENLAAAQSNPPDEKDAMGLSTAPPPPERPPGSLS